MIIGYGFRDVHVNAAVPNAIEHYDLKLFNWVVGPTLRSASWRHPTAHFCGVAPALGPTTAMQN
jgi:hypothetical protein